MAWSMILAQGAVQEDASNLYLIDDLSSEFDFEHRCRIGSYLAESSKQVFITGADQRSLISCCEGTSSRMFHVKHGQIDHLDD